MTDATVREHERRWRETGFPDDQARWLVARLRAGELSPERLEIAACLGSGAARVALDGRVRAWDPPADDPRAWLSALVTFGDEVLVRGLALALRAMDLAPWSEAARSTLGHVLAWCDGPTPERARTVASSEHVPLLEAAPAGPTVRLVSVLARSLDGSARSRQQLLALTLAGQDSVDLSHWLAFEARRLLREWALGLPPHDRATLPPVPGADSLARALERPASVRRAGLLRWLDGAPPAARVDWLVPFHASGWLRRTRVVDVHAAGIDLLHVSLPGGRVHRGLLFVDGAGDAWPLDHRRPEHLDRLFEAERDLPVDLDPGDLAALVAEALIARRNDRVRVIGALEDLERPDYVVDPSAAARYRAALSPPKLEGRTRWTLSFVCLSGWMHETQRLSRVVAAKEPGHPARLEREALCERVYARTPQIIY